MYERMKNEFLMELNKRMTLGNEMIQEIMNCLDVAIYDYDVKQKETQIVPYNQELPYQAKAFIVCKSVEGYSKGTLYNYKMFLTNFFQKVQKAPEQVVSNDIRVYLYQYQQERNISNRSLDKIRSALASFYKWMLVEGYIEKDPTNAINKIKYDKKPKVPCTQIDLEYLRRACKTPKEKAVLEMLYSTGCRVGELAILKKEDVNWQDKSVHLFGKGKKHRTSFLNAKAEVSLREYLNSRVDDNEWLFVSDRRPYDRMHVSGLQKIIRTISARTGSSVTKNVTPHILRHTMATRMIENKSDISSVQKILGHQSINTTMMYIHNTLEMAKTEHLKAVV